jgi:hypothetical protein
MPKREAFYSLFFKEYKGKRLCLLTVALDTGSAFALLTLSGMTESIGFFLKVNWYKSNLIMSSLAN